MISAGFEKLLFNTDLTNFETYVRLAAKVGSSDIHFEPMPGELRIRVRVEGQLSEVTRLPHPPGPGKPHACVVQIKARSNLNLQSRVPEDGRFDLALEDGLNLNVRVATMPQVWGEKVVLRIFDVQRIASLEGLGFRPESLERFRSIIDRAAGMVLVTGPTGSGKTTTLYSVLNSLNDAAKNICTVEDPVEFLFYGVNQIQVSSNLTFKDALRALMRHDPDVVMIGEIRDRETAETAFHAAMTGHLVLSTVHAKDTSGAVSRLLDLDVPPLILSQAINGIIAQRLLPKLCRHCAKREYHPPLEQVPTYEPVGCEQCLNSGYQDRQGVHEILLMTDVLRKMVAMGIPEEEFRLTALRDGMETLKEDAIFKSIKGMVGYRDAIGITDEPLNRLVADMPRLAAYMEM